MPTWTGVSGSLARKAALPLIFHVLTFWICGAAQRADAQLIGGEFQVNSYTTSYQLHPAAAMDGAGKFVVVWESVNQDGSESGVFGRRFDSAGAPLTAEFPVNTFTTFFQGTPAVASSATGEFLVVWGGVGSGDPYWGIFGQRYDAVGNTAGSEFRVNTYTTGFQSLGSIAADGLGNFVVVWSSPGQDGSDTGIFGQRFGPTGAPIGSEFQVNTYTTGYQVTPAVAADSAGNFLVVWSSVSLDISRAPLFGRRYDAMGTPQGADFLVNATTTEFLSDPAVAADGVGNFVVVWKMYEAGSGYDVFGRRVDGLGTPVGAEFPVNSHTPATQSRARVAAVQDGAFVVVWESLSNQDGSFSGVFARRFDSAGVPVTGEVHVNAWTTGDQAGPAIAADGSGAFTVAWMSDDQDGDTNGVFGQLLAPVLFADGFEVGNTAAWSDVAP